MEKKAGESISVLHFFFMIRILGYWLVIIQCEDEVYASRLV